MGINEILFGGLALIGILLFLFFGRYRSSRSQRERKNKINWSGRTRRKRKI